jgi:RNA polymerase sigma factor (sigma-70 family)
MPFDLAATYTEYGGAIVRWFSRRGIPWQESEDLAADTWVRALRYEKDYEDRGFDAKVLIYQVARSVYIDWIRSRATKMRGAYQTVPLDDAKNVTITPESVHDPDIMDAIKKIPQRQGMAILLYYVYELPRKEVADRMKVNPTTVTKLCNSGCKNLRILLSIDGDPLPVNEGLDVLIERALEWSRRY